MGMLFCKINLFYQDLRPVFKDIVRDIVYLLIFLISARGFQYRFRYKLSEY